MMKMAPQRTKVLEKMIGMIMLLKLMKMMRIQMLVHLTQDRDL